MDTDAHDVHCIFRKIGSAGIVILERDGILLKHKLLQRDLMLGDINDKLVEMLRQLREQNVLFGFLSRQTGVAGGFDDWSEYVGLTRMLDELLNVRGALPDFWLAWSARRRKAEPQHRNNTWRRPDAGTILRAIEWYGIDKNRAVVVSSSSAGVLASKDAGITGIQYSGWRNYQADPGRATETPRVALPPEITEVRGLRATLERILGLGR
ncbi:hypothetical protein [Rhizobium sp. 007]|uniref:hypothetical protein n=1 Tax=Rhizobium sp. 007 TaxID=2785056 RepID=UPI00188EBE33|nr:hypothetical protein [Rhizobium sp. 007]QPB24281.1 hypothetical protein ISN39_32405 [Rhizobium sp. 007]